MGVLRREAVPMIRIPESDEDLLAECEVETYRSSGPGGQNVNRRETAVRLRHMPTGAVMACQQERTQGMNKALALAGLRRLLEARNRKRRRRIPTAMPQAVRRRILDTKQRLSQKKRLRARPGSDE